MIKKINNFIQDRKIKRTVQRDLSPSQEKINAARAAFMSDVKERFPFAVQKTAPKHYARFAIAGVAALLILNSTAVIYADTTNVDAEHPLYSFKLVAEKVQVLASSEEKRAELELKFAERRMIEIETEEGHAEVPAETREQKKIMLKAKLEKHMVNAERFIAMKQIKRGALGITATTTASSTISVTGTSTSVMASSTTHVSATSTVKTNVKNLIKDLNEETKEKRDEIRKERDAALDALKDSQKDTQVNATSSTSIKSDNSGKSECKKFVAVGNKLDLFAQKGIKLNTKLDNINKYCQD